jgi:hypothetical protein
MSRKKAGTIAKILSGSTVSKNQRLVTMLFL